MNEGRCGETIVLDRSGLLGATVKLALPHQGAARVMKLPQQPAPMRVDVAGGGPVGLSFACTLKAVFGDRVKVHVYDRRWMRRDGRVVWKSAVEGNNRREQVVTLQSNVWAALPEAIQQKLFTAGKFSEMWPMGPDSPADKGRPRNIKIRWIEDCLLDTARGLHGPYDRQALVTALYERVKTIKARLASRMGPLPSDEWYLMRINALDVKTLKVLVESGAWITREIGGDEVVIPPLDAAPVRRLSLVS
jgi:hypothetical protein